LIQKDKIESKQWQFTNDIRTDEPMHKMGAVLNSNIVCVAKNKSVYRERERTEGVCVLKIISKNGPQYLCWQREQSRNEDTEQIWKTASNIHVNQNITFYLINVYKYVLIKK
jgi:hypothetical protein